MDKSCNVAHVGKQPKMQSHTKVNGHVKDVSRSMKSTKIKFLYLCLW